LRLVRQFWLDQLYVWLVSCENNAPLTLSRHRCLPDVLREPSTQQHVHQYRDMDHFTGDIRHVLCSRCLSNLLNIKA
jgi:hypothetical protein